MPVLLGHSWTNTLDPLTLQALKTPHSGYTMNVTSSSLVGLPVPLETSQAGVNGMTIVENDQRVPEYIFCDDVIDTYPNATIPLKK